jgi:hypothetical protein
MLLICTPTIEAGGAFIDTCIVPVVLAGGSLESRMTPSIKLGGSIMETINPRIVVGGSFLNRTGLAITSAGSLTERVAVAISIGGSLIISLTPAAALAAIYNAFIMNTKTLGMGEYTEFPFTSLFNHPLGPLGITLTGLFLLTGKTDNGVNIDAEILTGISDLGTKQRKLFPDAYLEIRGGVVELATILCEDVDGEIAYEADFSDEPHLKMQRISPLAGGVDGTHIQLRFRNIDGSDFDLQSIRMPYIEKTRVRGGR